MNAFAIEIQVEQGSQEWLELRLGVITGSRFKDVLAKISYGEAAARRNYRAELVVERLTGKEIERYRSKAMEWGNDTEELAALEYALRTATPVNSCGIFMHNEHTWGVSPDRLIIGQKGVVEIKCYEVANHIAALRSGHMPPVHKAQVQAEIWFTDSEFCDFVSYVPELPPNAQLFIERIYRDDLYIKELEAELILFEQEVDEEVRFVQDYKQAEIKKIKKGKVTV